MDLLDTDSTVAGSILADSMSPMITKVVSTLVAPVGHEVYIKAPQLYLDVVAEGKQQPQQMLTGWQVRERG